MFHLIPDDEYNTGLKRLEDEVLSGNFNCKNSGETLMWFKKKSDYYFCYKVDEMNALYILILHQIYSAI